MRAATTSRAVPLATLLRLGRVSNLPTVWTNVVAACSPCNTRKGNRLPEEIGMHPLTHPVEPHFVHLSWAVRRLTPTQARYIKTFYGSEVLHHLEQLEQRGHHPHRHRA